MKKSNFTASQNKNKIVSISLLYLISIAIIFLGIFFSVFSFINHINHINFKILNSYIPGFIFGFLVLYLGIRYYLSLTKLKEELFRTSSNFSLSNFRKKK